MHNNLTKMQMSLKFFFSPFGFGVEMIPTSDFLKFNFSVDTFFCFVCRRRDKVKSTANVRHASTENGRAGKKEECGCCRLVVSRLLSHSCPHNTFFLFFFKNKKKPKTTEHKRKALCRRQQAHLSPVINQRISK